MPEARWVAPPSLLCNDCSVKKVVRFYRPFIAEMDDSTALAPAGFWNGVHERLGDLDSQRRRIRIGSDPWFGDAGTGSRVALNFVRCGRERLRGDWPSVVDSQGEVVPLALADGNLFEASYLVPFGAEGERVAIVGPLRGSAALSRIEAWLGQALEFPGRGKKLVLEPIIDERVAEKLASSIGVSRLEVTIPANHSSVRDAPSSEVERAFAATEGLGAELDRTFTYSYANRKKGSRVEDLLRATRSILRMGDASKIKATLMLPRDGEIQTEVHDLIRDRVSVEVDFHIDDDSQPEIDDMLTGMSLAIREFQSRSTP